MFDLTGKTALVTGASGGIGVSIAKALHAQGATVGIHGTREERLAEIAAEMGPALSPGGARSAAFRGILAPSALQWPRGGPRPALPCTAAAWVGDLLVGARAVRVAREWLPQHILPRIPRASFRAGRSVAT